MMKKLLFSFCATLLTLSGQAQTTPTAHHRTQPSAPELDVSALRLPTASPRLSTTDASSIYGTWIKCDRIENDDMFSCSADTLCAPTDPETGNVRMQFSSDTYGYGQLDGDVLTFPAQYANDGAIFDDVSSHLIICGIKADRQTVAGQVVFVRNAEGNFQLADSLSGWYIYVEDGTYQHMKWWRAYDTELRRANATMTSLRTWWFETTRDTIPLSISDDGLMWNIYGWGPGVKIGVEVSPEDGKAVVQLPQNVANTIEDDWDSATGKYVLLCSKKADGTYEPGDIMWDMTEHEVEGTYATDGHEAVLSFPDVTFGTYSPFDDEGMAESMGDYAEVVIRRTLPVSDAIQRPQAATEPTVDAPAYNLAGQRVSESYRGLVIQGGVKRVRR